MGIEHMAKQEWRVLQSFSETARRLRENTSWVAGGSRNLESGQRSWWSQVCEPCCILGSSGEKPVFRDLKYTPFTAGTDVLSKITQYAARSIQPYSRVGCGRQKLITLIHKPRKRLISWREEETRREEGKRKCLSWYMVSTTKQNWFQTFLW